VRTDHVARDPALAALEHVAERVDEEVVADVVPAVRAHVVDLDRAHHGRASAFVLGVPPAVWCTTANATREAYDGEPRTIDSFAPHCRRVMIAGWVGAVASSRARTTGVTGLAT
jgi:myo-inositol catabolism protein IolC